MLDRDTVAQHQGQHPIDQGLGLAGPGARVDEQRVLGVVADPIARGLVGERLLRVVVIIRCSFPTPRARSDPPDRAATRRCA